METFDYFAQISRRKQVSFEFYFGLITGSSLIGILNIGLKGPLERAAEYWVKSLKRIVGTTKLLASEGSALLRSTELNLMRYALAPFYDFFPNIYSDMQIKENGQ
ncbi:hypothetical protein TNCT_635691 [Trichonephila clavata]|uniref:Uncharacterized protein n=1 Tax=Trichonephila clavata TaxID=2740835 RepID=A0A8X6FRW6_TRICU|nr:hypothetical protein TNCT_635691 [Trichonephila clavata]